MARVRLLDRLCERYPDRDREQLFALVLCGDVSVNGECLRDPASTVRPDAEIRIRERRYVGRGGYKLEHAIARWEISVSGRVVLDAGASTGGFTDCLLQNGARLVHAVDVGWNQLDYRLRNDSRVRVHERTNIMHLGNLDPPAQGAVADLSFRSLTGAAARIFELSGRSWAVLLIKPQFEWRDPPESFTGTVPDSSLPTILVDTLTTLRDEGLPLTAIDESPLRGRRGNREFLLLVSSGMPSRAPEDLVSVALVRS